MRVSLATSLVLSLMLSWIAGCGGAQTAPPAIAPATSPREMAIQVLEVGIADAQPDLVRALISPTYRQHNPHVVDGPEGLIGFVEEFTRRPASARPTIHVVRSIVDGDFVFLQAEYGLHGGHGSGVDMFRVENGRLAEHWDAGNPSPASIPSGRTLLDGPTDNGDPTQTEASKALVRQFAEHVMVAHSFDGYDAFFDGDQLIEHDLHLSDGAAALRAALESPDTVVVRDEVLRVLGEGELVAVEYRGKVGGALAVVYDIFRVTNSKLSERWSMHERVPEHMAHNNGMF